MSKKFTPSKMLLEKISEHYPTPYHLYSEKEIIDRVCGLNRAFSWNSGYREYYAVKACPTPGVIRIMQRLGCGVDCASLCELMLAEKMGFKGDEIMFSSNETPSGEFKYAKRLGAIINLDDLTMIDYIVKECGLPEKICLRFNPGGEFKIGNMIMGNPGDAKFGMTREQIFESAKKCMTLGVKEFGLHAFLASNTTDSSYYPGLARVLMELARDLTCELHCKIFMINLSGGIGIPYLPNESEADINEIGSGVCEAYNELLVKNGIDGVRICTELGRYMTGSAGCLITKAIHEKHTYKEYIGVDACCADLMRPAMYGAYHHITVAGKENEPTVHQYDIVGSLCENNDKFAIDRMLPKIEIGDYLIIHDTGAHGHSMGYNYNGRLRSAEILLKTDGSFELIRRAETPEDYFATLDICPEFK
ncbi:MAG: diaminopimelate decarboxylase [Clostridia bacterium]|nr:diaminopimelate decarboxylase [Clostridia bacterium]